MSTASSILVWWRGIWILYMVTHISGLLAVLILSLEWIIEVILWGWNQAPDQILASLHWCHWGASLYIIRKQTTVYYVSQNKGEWGKKCRQVPVQSRKDKGLAERKICSFSPALPRGQVFWLLWVILLFPQKYVPKVERAPPLSSASLRNSIICALFCSHQANCQLPTWLSSKYPPPPAPSPQQRPIP